MGTHSDPPQSLSLTYYGDAAMVYMHDQKGAWHTYQEDDFLEMVSSERGVWSGQPPRSGLDLGPCPNPPGPACWPPTPSSAGELDRGEGASFAAFGAVGPQGYRQGSQSLPLGSSSPPAGPTSSGSMGYHPSRLAAWDSTREEWWPHSSPAEWVRKQMKEGRTYGDIDAALAAMGANFRGHWREQSMAEFAELCRSRTTWLQNRPRKAPPQRQRKYALNTTDEVWALHALRIQGFAFEAAPFAIHDCMNMLLIQPVAALDDNYGDIGQVQFASNFMELFLYCGIFAPPLPTPASHLSILVNADTGFCFQFISPKGGCCPAGVGVEGEGAGKWFFLK